MRTELSRALQELEETKVSLILEDRNIRAVYRCERSALPSVLSAIAILKQHKQEVLHVLKTRDRGSIQAQGEQTVTVLRKQDEAPPMPAYVKLVSWNPKDPPILTESCSVVFEVPVFIKNSLAQLGAAVSDPKRWTGWSVEQLVDRLNQVGVVVEVGRPDAGSNHN